MSPIKISNNATKDTFLLDTVIKERNSVGIIVQDMDCSQFAFEASHQMYEYLDKTNRTELLFFCQNWKRPCLSLPTGMFHIHEMMGYRGHIISGTIDGVLDALRVKTIKSIIWFIYDITEVMMYNPEYIQKLLNTKGVHRIFRDEHYKQTIQKFAKSDKKVTGTIMPYLDLEAIINMIYPPGKHLRLAQ